METFLLLEALLNKEFEILFVPFDFFSPPTHGYYMPYPLIRCKLFYNQLRVYL